MVADSAPISQAIVTGRAPTLTKNLRRELTATAAPGSLGLEVSDVGCDAIDDGEMSRGECVGVISGEDHLRCFGELANEGMGEDDRLGEPMGDEADGKSEKEIVGDKKSGPGESVGPARGDDVSGPSATQSPVIQHHSPPSFLAATSTLNSGSTAWLTAKRVGRHVRMLLGKPPAQEKKTEMAGTLDDLS